MDNKQLGTRLYVKADNSQEAYYILTPRMMGYTTVMADGSGGAIYMSSPRNGKLHATIQTGRDFFELRKSNMDVGGPHRKFLGELRWFTDIADTLHVEDTFHKKETNAWR